VRPAAFGHLRCGQRPSGTCGAASGLRAPAVRPAAFGSPAPEKRRGSWPLLAYDATRGGANCAYGAYHSKGRPSLPFRTPGKGWGEGTFAQEGKYCRFWVGWGNGLCTMIFWCGIVTISSERSLFPRTALRLSWAIFRRSSGANVDSTRSFKTQHAMRVKMLRMTATIGLCSIEMTAARK